jgi:hypothetical protein
VRDGVLVAPGVFEGAVSGKLCFAYIEQVLIRHCVTATS